MMLRNVSLEIERRGAEAFWEDNEIATQHRLDTPRECVLVSMVVCWEISS